MTKALAIEILPAMASAYQGALQQLTSFGRNDCTSGISGSNVLGVSWQWQYFPFMYPNTSKKKKTKTHHPPVNFLAKAKIFCLNAFPLKPGWILFQRNFLWVFLEIWWLHDVQYTWVLHHFGNAAGFQNIAIKRLNQAIFCPRKDPRTSLFRKNDQTHVFVPNFP